MKYMLFTGITGSSTNNDMRGREKKNESARNADGKKVQKREGSRSIVKLNVQIGIVGYVDIIGQDKRHPKKGNRMSH